MENSPSEKKYFAIETDTEKIQDSESSERIKVQDVLENINETAMKNILWQDLKRSGIQKVKMNAFIPLQDIKTDGQLGTAVAGYSPGKINLYPNALHEDTQFVAQNQAQEQLEKIMDQMNNAINLAESDRTDTSIEKARTLLQKSNELAEQLDTDIIHLSEFYLKVKTIHSVFHEQLHALTDTGWEEESYGGREDHISRKTKKETRYIGFAQSVFYDTTLHDHSTHSSKRLTNQENSNTGISEAVTQLISIRMTKQYLHQNPLPGLATEHIDTRLHETNIGYTEEMFVTEQYIALISVFTDASEEMILNGLFREYANNNTYLPDEFAKLLLENIGGATEERKNIIKIIAEDVTKAFRTTLAENTFSHDSGFYEMLFNFIYFLPQEKQNLINEKLIVLNEKYHRPGVSNGTEKEDQT